MLPALGTRNERVLVTADLTLGGSSVREGVPAELGPATDRAIPIASTKPSEPLRRIEDGRQRLRSMFPSPARARRDGRHHTARKRRPGSEGRVDPGGKSAGTHPSRSRRRSQPTASRNIKARSRSCPRYGSMPTTRFSGATLDRGSSAGITLIPGPGRDSPITTVCFTPSTSRRLRSLLRAWPHVERIYRAKAKRLRDPNLLRAGQTILIPLP